MSLNKDDFKNLVWDLLFTYRQFLLNGNLHKEIDSGTYNSNPSTWNTLLLSLESGVVLGLAKLLENKYFGKTFNNQDIDVIAEKIKNIRDKFIAHNDLSKMRNRSFFIEENQLNGSDIINMIDALKNRAIQYEKIYQTDVGVQQLFNQTTNNAMSDIKVWLEYFK